MKCGKGSAFREPIISSRRCELYTVMERGKPEGDKVNGKYSTNMYSLPCAGCGLGIPGWVLWYLWFLIVREVGPWK